MFDMSVPLPAWPWKANHELGRLEGLASTFRARRRSIKLQTKCRYDFEDSRELRVARRGK